MNGSKNNYYYVRRGCSGNCFVHFGCTQKSGYGGIMIRIHRKQTRKAVKQSSVMIPGRAQARWIQPPNRGTVDISAQFQEGY